MKRMITIERFCKVNSRILEKKENERVKSILRRNYLRYIFMYEAYKDSKVSDRRKTHQNCTVCHRLAPDNNQRDSSRSAGPTRPVKNTPFSMHILALNPS